MKIKNISIQNYKSIKNLSFDIKTIAGKSCHILLGVNESGKSNILQAFHLKDCTESELNYSNTCERGAESDGEEISVKYELSDLGRLDKFFADIDIPKELLSVIKIKNIYRVASMVKDLSKENCLHIYIENNKEKFSKYVIFNGKIQLQAETNQELNEEDKVINFLDEDTLEKHLEEKLFDVIEGKIPKIIFWKSSEEYLINKPVDLNEFKGNHSISRPLKNCFDIAGIDDIDQKIAFIEGNPVKKSELQDLLGDEVTKHINKIWEEHKISIKFDIDGMRLTFLVKDEGDNDNKYKFEASQRSDGFKQFVSILLNLSIENETGTLKNKIILLDEPETHLHPSGQKYLRDELLKISKNNLVIYATHSIYMVDTKNLDRHVSVKKKDSLTQATQIEQDNPYDEEVLYRALGTSVLEHIEKNILIVEGKTDKDAFELYFTKCRAYLKPPKLSIISVDGANNASKYVKFLNNNLLKGFVLLDSDKKGAGVKKSMLEKKAGRDEENTFEINDLFDTKLEATLEDLFDKSYLEKAMSNAFNVDVILDENKPLMKQVKKNLQDKNMKFKDDEKAKLKQFHMKNIVALKSTDLRKEKFYKVAKALISKINA